MSKLTRTIQIELGKRKKQPAGGSVFSAVISTEVGVKRKDWDRGEYTEVLVHSPDAIDLSRSPLPLLESHDAQSLPIGVVDNLRILDKKLRGDVRFGNSARAIEVAADVEAGIIRNLSIGYSISATTETRSDDDSTTLTATRWAPHEVSAVAIPADSGAGFNRSYTMEPNEEENSNRNESTPQTQERERCIEITRMGRAMKIRGDLTERLVRGGASIEKARAELMDAYCEQAPDHLSGYVGDPTMNDASGYEAIRGHNRAPMSRGGSGNSGDGEFRTAAVDALLMRSGVQVANPHAAARDISASVIDLARVCVSRAGATVRGGDERLIKRALSTGDFNYILMDAMHKATRLGYADEPASHRQWVRAVPVLDFRDQHRVILGSAPSIEKVEEGAEYTHGALDDDGTFYRVAKYGRIVSLTWETLKNDSLSSFLRVQPSMGQAARRKEADLIYALFAENGGNGPAMTDGVNLFDLAAHGNVTAAGALDVATLGAARSLLRKQQATGGGYLSLVPRFMIVPSERETDAEVLLAKATKHIGSSSESGTPQWLQKLELVVEPRLANNAFFLAADSSQIDTIELGLLDENMSGPTLEEEKEFSSDIMRWKVRHAMGTKAIDWRGLIRVPLS